MNNLAPMKKCPVGCKVSLIGRLVLRIMHVSHFFINVRFTAYERTFLCVKWLNLKSHQDTSISEDSFVHFFSSFRS